MKRKQKSTDTITLSDIIRGMQYCVNTSAEIAEQHYVKSFEKFFNDKGELLTQQIRLNDQMQINLPLICLSNHNTLDFDEMSIKMHLDMLDVQTGATETPFQYEDKKYVFTRGRLSVALGSDSNHNSLADIEMKFKRTQPPEAVSRLIEKLNNAVEISKITYESEDAT